MSKHIRAPRTVVYEALLDAESVQRWMVPDDMSSNMHHFEGHEGGTFRISLIYDDPTSTGKSDGHTDTHHGRFAKLVPDREVVQVVEFETDDPSMQGEMTITYTLTDADGGTQVQIVHENLPPGVPPDANELGTTMSLDKLAELVETAVRDVRANQDREAYGREPEQADEFWQEVEAWGTERDAADPGAKPASSGRLRCRGEAPGPYDPLR